MKKLFRNISLLLLMAWTCILFSSCGVLSYFESMGSEAILWEELENSVDEETAAKDTTSFHNARYQVKSRIVMSDLERVSSEHILKLFSDQVISEIGREALASSLEKMAESIQGELLSYETRDRGGSGQRGGSGETTRTYEVVIYTDMDIYEMYLYEVTMDTSSDDGELGSANEGFHHIVLLPVDLVYEKTEDEMTRYGEYLGKDGVFYEESPQAARKVIYPGKKYTGYSIAYLQEYFYEAAKKESCEKLMDLLDSVGFQGDITNISYLSADGDFPDAYEEGYRLLVADETGAEYFVAGAQWEKGVCVQPLKIADTGMRVLYEEAL